MRRLLFFILFAVTLSAGPVKLGVDRFFGEDLCKVYKRKRVGLITNHTGVDSDFRTTIDLCRELLDLVALFSPEHGINGNAYAWEKVPDGEKDRIPIHSLHGKTRRPTSTMLEGIDLLLYDIQGIGVRSYNYRGTT